jgi:DNA-binding NarL/FixJ family response regulator
MPCFTLVFLQVYMINPNESDKNDKLAENFHVADAVSFGIDQTAGNNPSAKRKTYLLSTLNLHNELIAYAITNECNAECVIITDIKTIDDFEDRAIADKSSFIFLLIDSRFFSFEELLLHISTRGKKSIDYYRLVLYNLANNTGIEAKALSKGVKGFFYLHDTLQLFLKGIKSVLEGKVWVSRDVLLKCAIDGFKIKRNLIKEKDNLTEREIEILNLISMGASNKEIAEKISISDNTVKTHLYNIFKKIKVTNRLQAAIWAAKNL